MPPAPFPRRALIEELEPRLLFSADFAPALADALAPQSESRVLDASGEFSGTASNEQQAQHARLEVVFIDLRVQGYEKILADIHEQNTDGHSIEIVLLDSERDGVAQIGEFLSQRQDVDAIHLISHGSAGSVQLGSGELNFDSLLANASAIKQWGNALSAEADILIYGCDLASTEQGQSLVNALGKLTGADVAASDDKTGAAELGGDWLLEYHTGVIQAQVVVSVYGQQNWDGVLATFTVTNTLDTGAGSLREAINNANANGAGLDTINFNIAGTGIHTINLGSALSVQGAVTIDATTDNSFAANGNRPAIVLNGGGMVQDGIQLYTNSSGSTIRGFVIQNFTQDGIDISGSNNNTIVGNWIGLNAAGTGAAGNQQGVNLWNSNNNIIGGGTAADRNVISGNTGPGISINTNNGTSTGNQIRGNYIGTDSTGTNAVGNSNQGVYLNAANNTIGGTVSGYGNVISGTLNWSGIGLDTNASGTLIAGNRIGTNAAGTAALANNGGGISVLSANNTIGGITAEARNVISGNNSRGVYIAGAAATGNVVVGNYIGTDISGTLDLDGTAQVNGKSGVVIDGGATNNRIGTNADGINDAAERNVISGNNWFGVEMIGTAATSGNVVQGNHIGTNATGLAALGNSNGGVSFWGGSNNTLGSGLSGAGNVISGNGTGVLLANAASGNKVQGNLIGLGADGSTLVGNAGVGVYFYNGGNTSATTGNIIGTNADGSNDAAERNVISGNYRGIALEDAEATGNVVAGNYIGTDASGTLNRGNTSDGVYILDGANANRVGGTQAAQANTIAFNGRDGIRVEGTASTGNVFLRNAIHSNTGLGINLVGGSEDAYGVTANDASDADNGPNNLLNSVTFQQAVTNSSTLYLSGTFSGAPNTYYRIDIFTNSSAEPSGTGEGRAYIGSVNGPVDASGTLSGTYSFTAAVPVGAYISATTTRTDATYTTFYETSEFSNHVVATAPNTAPSGSNGTITATEDQDYTFMTADFGFSDADGDALMRVWFDTLPASGTLKWNGTAFAAGNWVDAADIASGLLTYTPATGLNGAGIASFTFRVQDDGGTLGGGVDTDPTANTLTINVAAVNDPPTDIVFDSEASVQSTVNAYGTSDQIDPAIAAFSDGGYIVVWASNGQDGSNYGIYGQRYNADGTKNGAEFLVTSEVTDAETSPSVATFADGGFVVAWQDQTSGVMAWTEARVFNANGTAATAEFKVSPGTDGNNEGYQPAVVALDSNRFVVVWANESSGTTYEVTGRIYDRTGTALTTQFSIGSLMSGTGLFGAQTEVTRLDDGGFAVVWRTHDGSNLGVRARVMNSDGTARSAQLVLSGNNVADIASLSNGGFVATYDAAGALKATIFNASGTVTVPEFTVNTTTSAARYESTVTRSDNGFVVAWESSTGDGSGSAILAQRFDASGNKIGSEVIVNQTTTGNQQKPEIIATTAGKVIAAWQSENVDAALTGIALRAFATGNATVAENAINGTRVADVIGVFDLDAGDTHTYSLIDSAGGRFAINGSTGVITVANAPLLDYETNTTHTLIVRVTDNGGLTYDESLTINVANVNDAPAGTNNAVTTNEDTAYTFTTADFGFSDADGNSLLAVKITTLPGAGSLTLNGVAVTTGQFVTAANITSGLLKFTPAANANGAGYTSFTFQVQDNGGTANGGVDLDPTPNTITVNVTAVNDAPTATNLSAPETYTEDTPLNLTDIVVSDVDSANVTVTLTLSNAAAGSLNTGTSGAVTSTYNAGTGVWTASGTIADVNTLLAGLTFTPTVNFNGNFTIATSVSDGVAAPVTGSKAMTGTPVNDAPVAVDDAVAGNEDNDITGNVLSNDTDVDNASLTAILVSGPAHGSLVFNADGSFTYTPNANFNGPDSFTYKANDGSLDSNVATVTLTVNPVNNAPTVTPVNLGSINEDGSRLITQADLLAGASDVDGDTLTAINLALTSGSGTLTDNGDGTWAFNPATNWNGSATFSFDTSDGTTTTPNTASCTVNSVSDAPVAADDRLALDFDGTDDYVSIPDSVSLQMSSTMTMEAWIKPDVSSNATQIILNKEGEYEMALFPDGSLQVAFAEGGVWAWHDTGAVVDRNTWSHIAVVYDFGTVTTYVNGSLVGTLTLATSTIDDVYAGMNELRIGGRTNNPAGQYFDGQIADVRIWNVARSGAEIAAAMNTPLTGAEAGLAGCWTLDENSGAVATDRSANANHGNLVNGAGWAGYRLNEDSTLNVAAPGVQANDYDAEGDTLQAILVSGPAHGGLVLNADGSFTYTPDADWHGTDSFTYKLNDGALDSNVATVYITVDPMQDAPTVANPIGDQSATEDAPFSFQFAANTFHDADAGDTLTHTVIGLPAWLSFDAATRTFSGTPANGDVGVYTLTVRATDGSGAFVEDQFDVTVINANDAPVLSPIGNQSINEGATLTFTATASDTDVPANTLTFSLSGAPVGATIDAGTGVFSWTPTEAQGAGVYSFDVVVSDGAATDSETISVTVHEINAAPTGTDNTVTTPEDTAYVFTAADFGFGDAGDSPANALLAVRIATLPGAGGLNLNGVAVTAGQEISVADIDAGLLRFTPAADAFGTGYASFTFQVRDGGGTANGGVDLDPTPNTITIDVTAVNDAPVLDSASLTVSEGQMVTLSGANFGITDPDSASFTYTVSGVTGGYFQLSTATGTPITSFSSADLAGGLVQFVDDGNEVAPAFSVTVNDGAANSNTLAATINYTPINDAPVITSNGGGGTATLTVPENTTAVTVVTSSDVDGPTATYSISGGVDAGLFTIDSATGALSFITAPNREAPTDSNGDNTYEVTVQISDGAGGSDSQAISVSVTDVNEFAVTTPVDSDATANAVDENAANGTVVGITTFASDADATTNGITYTLDDDAGGRFAIDSVTGVVTVNAALDFETAASHSIVVRATSADGSSATQGFTIGVVDANETGITAISDTDAGADFVIENAANGTTVGLTAFADDADGTDSVSYSLDDNAGGRFAIDANTGVVTVAGAIDREAAGAYSITVRATSTDTSTTTRTFGITIGDVDEFDVSPVIDTDAATNAVDENAAVGTVVGITAFASDADATTSGVTYSLTDNDGGCFAIDSATGAVTVAGAIDREADGATRNITVRATSADGSFDEQVFSIGIDDVDEFDVALIVDTDAAANQVSENAANGTVVGITAFASDADATTNGITYTLDDEAGGRFAIDSVTGVVTVADGSLLDYETATSHAITLRATSSDGSHSTLTLSINVAPVNDNAPVITSDGGGVATTLNVAENTTAVTTVTASDADLPAQTLTYAIVGGADASLFTIDSNSGTLSFNVPPDFEAPADAGLDNVYEVIVQVSDGAFNDSQTLSVTVTPVNDNAPVSAPVTLAPIAEDSGAHLITQAELLAGASDADGDSLTATGLAISSGSGTLIDNDDGTWTYTPTANDDTSVSFSYTVTDGSLTAAGSASMDITPVNDAPVVAPADLGNMNEDGGRLITQADLLTGTNDVDTGDTLTATNLALISGSGSLTDNGDGTWTFTPDADWNGSVAFSFDVNDGTAVVANSASLLVDPVNDAPVITTNTLNLLEGETVVLGSANLNVSDAEQTAAQLIYTISNIVHGQFEWAAAPGTAITSFTQTDIDAGLVVFVHDASDFAPSYDVSVSDGTTSVGPQAAVINFTPVDEGINVTSLSGTNTTEAGGMVTFDVTLNSQPFADVTVFIVSGNVAEGTVSVSSLTFTAANWNVAQQVTVIGENDFIDDGNQAYVIELQPAVSADRNYDALDTGDVTLTNLDDDTAGITITPASGLVTDESGASDTFSVVLTSQPLADVVIDLNSSNMAEGTLSANSLTFTPGNWNIPQLVTVTGVNDLPNDGDIAYQAIAAPAASADSNYNGLASGAVDITNLDVADPVAVDPPAEPVPSEPGPQPLPDGEAGAPENPAEKPVEAAPAAVGNDPGQALAETAGTGEFTRTNPVEAALNNGLKTSAPMLVNNETPRREVLTHPETQGGILLRVLEILQVEHTLADGNSHSLGSAIKVEITQDDNFQVEILSQGAQITAVSLSVGAVWWALRAGGLFTSLLTSLPAWRSFDMLPVLSRDEDDDDASWNFGDEPEEDGKKDDTRMTELAP